MDWEGLGNMPIILNMCGKVHVNCYVRTCISSFLAHQIITINGSIPLQGSDHWFVDVEVLSRLIEENNTL